jgi:hypothetical protein
MPAAGAELIFNLEGMTLSEGLNNRKDMNVTAGTSWGLAFGGAAATMLGCEIYKQSTKKHIRRLKLITMGDFINRARRNIFVG